jgi:hypothetical protein
MNNNGTIDVQSGVLDLDGGGISSGTFLVEKDATLEFGGGIHTLIENSSVSGAGDVIFDSETFNDLWIVFGGTYNVGGTTTLRATNAPFSYPHVTLTAGGEMGALKMTTGWLYGDGDITVDGVLTWTGGAIGGNAQLNANGGLVISGDAGKTLDGRTLNNAGVATWSGTGGISFINGASLNNLATGTFDIQTDGTFGAGGVFINTGSLKKSAGTATTLSGSVTNLATLEVDAGKLTIAGDLQNQGDVIVNAGATLQVDGVFTQLAGTLTLTNGTLTVTPGDKLLNLQGGALYGTGTINANVFNSAQIFPGGDGTTGILTINGNYTQTADGVLSIDLGGTTAGTGYDQLKVNGAATLGGTLLVNLVGAYMPVLGDTFQVMTFTSHTGDFAAVTFPTLDGGLFLVENLEGTDLKLETHS